MELSLRLDYTGDPRAACDEVAELESAALDAVRVAEAHGFRLAHPRDRVEAFREAGVTLLDVTPVVPEPARLTSTVKHWLQGA
ncbi:hypothetical protein ACWD04_25465 [Streptomyces sp. NPDC002911]